MDLAQKMILMSKKVITGLLVMLVLTMEILFFFLMTQISGEIIFQMSSMILTIQIALSMLIILNQGQDSSSSRITMIKEGPFSLSLIALKSITKLQNPKRRRKKAKNKMMKKERLLITSLIKGISSSVAELKQL